MIEADDKWQVAEISLLGKSAWDKEVEDGKPYSNSRKLS